MKGLRGPAGSAPPGGSAAPEWLRRLAWVAGGASPDELPPRLRSTGDGGRRSAVLILFGEGPAGPDVLLTERSAGLRDHAGQPAFPGGSLASGDSGPEEAALREAAEETGLERDGVEVLVALPELRVERTGFRVTAVLAWWSSPCEVSPTDPTEVAAVTSVAVRDLADPANRVRVRHPSGRVGPAFHVGGMLVWGFTGGLLDWLVRIGGWERPWLPAPVEDLPPGPA